LIIKKVFDEIGIKYKYLMPSVNELLDNFKKINKFESIENTVFKQHISKITQLKSDAESEEISLSFQDALQIFHSKNIGIPLITWDSPMIDYCEILGITVFRPNEFYDDYKSKYC